MFSTSTARMHGKKDIGVSVGASWEAESWNGCSDGLKVCHSLPEFRKTLKRKVAEDYIAKRNRRENCKKG